MKTHGLESVLREHPFFSGLTDETVDLIAGCAKNVRFDDGTVIARQGEDADAFYLLREGRVAIGFPAQQAGRVTIQTLDEGDVIGWSWLIPPHTWQFDVVAVTRARAIEIDGRCLRGKCDEDTALGYELMKRFSAAMVQRLQATHLQLMNLYGNNNGNHFGSDR